MSRLRLEEIPEPMDLGEDHGRTVWHENAEMRKLVRPFTALEWQDRITYDRARYRVREQMQAEEKARTK